MTKNEFDRILYVAGGSPARLRDVFVSAGYLLSRQAVQQWCRNRRLPPQRELQLRRIRWYWFTGRANGQEASKAKAVSASKAAALKPRRGPRKAGQAQRAGRRRAALPS